MTAPYSAWDRLLAVATLGTRKRPLPQDSSKESVWPSAELAQSTPIAANENTLLRAAAANWLYHSAGTRVAAADAPTLVPAFPESMPPLLSEAATWRLARIINGEYRDLMEEWFTLAKETRKVLPPHWLPVVFQGVPARLRTSFAEVLGPAAEWLAAQHPDWDVRPLAHTPTEQRWQEGTLAERRAELACLREQDPARAREWLQSTWATDSGEARSAFLDVLAIGLDAEDEGLLEAALDDKRKRVRTSALALLPRLPESAYVHRQEQRLESFIDLRAGKLVVELPTTPDKAAQRDGLDLKPPPQLGRGERTYWLTQMVASVPPEHWCQRYHCDAATWIAAVSASEHAAALLPAMTTAATRHADAAWVRALYDAWCRSGFFSEKSARAGLATKGATIAARSHHHVRAQEPAAIANALLDLLRATAPHERDALLEAHLRSGTRLDVLLEILAALDVPWTAALTSLVGQHLFGATARALERDMTRLVNRWVVRCDAAAALQLLPAWRDRYAEDSAMRRELERLIDVVEFRASMRRELA